MATSTTNHWKLGLFITLGLAIAVGVLIWIGSYGLNRRSVEVVTYFDESVQGLDIGSAIKFRGVPIGSVVDIAVAPDRRRVEITCEVYSVELQRLGLQDTTNFSSPGRAAVPAGLRLQLVPIGITGLKFLEANFFDPVRYPPPHLPFNVPYNYLPSTPSTLVSLEEAVMEAISTFPKLQDQITATLKEAEGTLISIQTLMDPFTEDEAGLVGLVQHLEGAAANLESATAGLESAMAEAQVGQTTASIRKAANSVADAAHEATGLQGDVRESIVRLLDALESIRTLADTLERDPSALLRGRSLQSGPEGGN